MAKVASQQDVLRDEMKRQETEVGEKLASLDCAVSRQNHGYQMELKLLQEQLRALKSSASS